MLFTCIDPQILILDSLHYCMLVNTDDALNSEGMQTFSSLLTHESPVIRSKACQDIMHLRWAGNLQYTQQIILQFIGINNQYNLIFIIDISNL